MVHCEDMNVESYLAYRQGLGLGDPGTQGQEHLVRQVECYRCPDNNEALLGGYNVGHGDVARAQSTSEMIVNEMKPALRQGVLTQHHEVETAGFHRNSRGGVGLVTVYHGEIRESGAVIRSAPCGKPIYSQAPKTLGPGITCGAEVHFPKPTSEPSLG